MCFIGFVPNITFCPKHNMVIALPHFLQFTLVAYCKQDACFGIFGLCAGFLLFSLSISIVEVTTILLIHPQLSEPLNSDTESHHWPHGEIPEPLPSSLVTELGRTPVTL